MLSTYRPGTSVMTIGHLRGTKTINRTGETIVAKPERCLTPVKGDHFAEEGVRDYLLGYVTRGPDGDPVYTALWATTREEERATWKPTSTTSLWASTRRPTSRSVRSTRSATRAAATRRTCGMDPVPSTPSSTSTTVRSTIRTCPAASTGRNSGSIRTLVRWHGLPRRPRSGTRASTASRSRRLALPCSRIARANLTCFRDPDR